MGTQSLAEEARSRAKDVRVHIDDLAGASKTLPAIFKGDPVRVKHLEMIADSLLQISTFLDEQQGKARNRQPEDPCFRSLVDQLEKPEDLSSDGVWELAYQLDIQLIRLGDDPYLHTLLCSQEQLDQNDATKWDIHLPKEELSALLGRCKDGELPTHKCRKQVKRNLEYLRRTHVDEMRLDRAAIRLWGIYLGRMALVLLSLFVLLLATIQLGGIEFQSSATPPKALPLVLLVALAGALGSVLSRAIKLGKKRLGVEAKAGASRPPLRIRVLMSEWAAFLAQPVIGAVSALAVLLVVSAGFVTIAGTETAGANVFALIGFLAGFSEPYFIGVLDRVSEPAGG